MKFWAYLNRSLLATTASLIMLTTLTACSQTIYGVDWYSLGGGGGSSAGATYSVSGAAGSAASDLLRSPTYELAGSVNSAVVIVPSFPSSGFYVGIDFSDPAQALADFDGDGLSNLMELALGSDPRSPTGIGGALVISTVTGAGIQIQALKFKRRNNADMLKLEYIPEISTDGQTWYSDPGHLQETAKTPLDSEFDWVTVQEQSPTVGAAVRFFRLRLAQN